MVLIVSACRMLKLKRCTLEKEIMHVKNIKFSFSWAEILSQCRLFCPLYKKFLKADSYYSNIPASYTRNIHFPHIYKAANDWCQQNIRRWGDSTRFIELSIWTFCGSWYRQTNTDGGKKCQAWNPVPNSNSPTSAPKTEHWWLVRVSVGESWILLPLQPKKKEH